MTDSNRKQDLFPFYFLFEQNRERILAHTFHFHYIIGMIQSIEKSYFFEEKFLLLLVQSRQHFLHNHSFNNLSWSFGIHGVNISKPCPSRYFTGSALQSKRGMLTILLSADFRFLNSCGSLKCRKTDMIYQDQDVSDM